MRHLLGIVAGLLLPPLIAAGLLYGVSELTLTMQRMLAFSWLGLGLLVLSGIALAFLAGSRLSPVASLLGGLTFVAVGSLPLLELMGRTRILPRGFLPAMLDNGYRNLSYQGILLVIGVLLLVVSAFPSRWRGVRPAFDASTGPYGPAYPPAQHAPSYAPHPHGPSHASGSPDRPGGPDPYARNPYSPDVPQQDTTRPMHRE
ncbi:hypothetical protein ACIBQX_07385 [Nonomuraea sp. NPDC049714]|uniref:hypothetical protein n=1 Tax=Nonomuraea sp. NPDC049714 TaxID=3364357 RepID=UPI0037BC3745